LSDSKPIFFVWDTKEYNDRLLMHRVHEQIEAFIRLAYMCDVIRTGAYGALWADGV